MKKNHIPWNYTIYYTFSSRSDQPSPIRSCHLCVVAFSYDYDDTVSACLLLQGSRSLHDSPAKGPFAQLEGEQQNIQGEWWMEPKFQLEHDAKECKDVGNVVIDEFSLFWGDHCLNINVSLLESDESGAGNHHSSNESTGKGGADRSKGPGNTDSDSLGGPVDGTQRRNGKRIVGLRRILIR